MHPVTDYMVYLVYAIWAGTALYMIVKLSQAFRAWCRGERHDATPTSPPVPHSTIACQEVYVHVHVVSSPQNVPHAQLVTPTGARPTAPPMSPSPSPFPRAYTYTTPTTSYVDDRTSGDLALALELQQQEHDRIRRTRYDY